MNEPGIMKDTAFEATMSRVRHRHSTCPQIHLAGTPEDLNWVYLEFLCEPKDAKAAEVYEADHSDTQTLADSVVAAASNAQQAGVEQEIEEAVADKGYHAAGQLELVRWLGFRTYIPEPQRMGLDGGGSIEKHGSHDVEDIIERLP